MYVHDINTRAKLRNVAKKPVIDLLMTVVSLPVVSRCLNSQIKYFLVIMSNELHTRPR